VWRATLQGKKRGAVASFGLLGDGDRNAENALPDPGPSIVLRATADADDTTQGRCAEPREPLVGEGLDRGDTLEQALEEAMVLRGSGRDPASPTSSLCGRFFEGVAAQ
jgi:hypothetical protein